jgi:ABC-type transport system substrate-binding protein
MYRRSNPQQPLKITLDSAVLLFEEAQAVAQDWQNLGLAAQKKCEAERTAKTENQDCSRFGITVDVRLIRDLQEAQAILIGREIPRDPDQYAWWHSNQASNLSKYQNPRVDKLLEDARKETDQQKRKVMYFEFQKYLVEDVPAIFLYYAPQFTVERKNRL